MGEKSGNTFNKRSHFPVIIADLDRNAREVVRVSLDEYNGHPTINIRIWYYDGQGLKPSRSGITLGVSKVPGLAAALAEADRQARDLGLIGGE